MEQPRIEQTILHDSYESWFLQGRLSDLNQILAKGGWDAQAFWKTVDRMDENGYVRPVAIGGIYEITPKGIVLAENQTFAPKELSAKNQHARTVMLDALAQVYEEEGNQAYIHYQALCDKTNLDATVVVGNLQVLEELGYVESTGWGEKITRWGLQSVQEWRQQKAIVDEFERISELSPQPRGRALQILFAKIVEQQGWSQEEGVRTSNEEMDVIVYREREFHLVECKWEKDPIEANVIRELYGKLSNRATTGGVVASMSGFTQGAVEQVHDYAGTQVILLV